MHDRERHCGFRRRGVWLLMPTIEVNYQDLQSLIGTHVPLDVLQEEGIMYAKGEVEGIEGEVLKLDMKDTNRPDLWSAEGIARELAGRYAAVRGVPRYGVKPSGLVVKVDRKLEKIRPLTVCAVVRNLNITPDVLSQMIQLQEKISMTFGRNRKEVAIGVYDLHKITSPVRFTSVRPDGIRFVPLESDSEMTPAEILKKHPKGLEYAGLLKGLSEYPIFIDAAGEVLSMPPIINSGHTGKVTTATRDVFIECSGFDFKFLSPALSVIAAALADRGGELQSVRVEYHDGVKVTPDMKPGKAVVDVAYAKGITGLSLSAKDMCGLLSAARYDASVKGKKISGLQAGHNAPAGRHRGHTDIVRLQPRGAFGAKDCDYRLGDAAGGLLCLRGRGHGGAGLPGDPLLYAYQQGKPADEDGHRRVEGGRDRKLRLIELVRL